MSTRPRVALFGGDGRNADRFADRGDLTIYQSRHDGGAGERRRLIAALKAGSFDLVILFARWNGHSATREVRKVCQTHNVRVEVIR